MSDEIPKSKIVDLVKRLIKKQEDIRDRINQKLKEIQKHHRNCNIARTVGVSVAAAGTIFGIVGAIFTLGLSLIIGGLVAVAAGTATTLGTTVADAVKSKNFIKDVKKMIKEQAALAEELRLELEAELKAVDRYLMPLQDHMDGKVVRYRVLAQQTGATLWAVGELTYNITKATGVTSSIDISAKVDEMLKSSGKVGRYIARGIKFFGPFVEFIGMVLKIATPVLGAIGIMTDINYIVNNWTTAHPTEKGIRQQLNNLEQSIKNLKNLLKELQK